MRREGSWRGSERAEPQRTQNFSRKSLAIKIAPGYLPTKLLPREPIWTLFYQPVVEVAAIGTVR